MGSPLCAHICAGTNMGSPLPTSAPGLIGLTPFHIGAGTKPPSLTPVHEVGPNKHTTTHTHTNKQTNTHTHKHAHTQETNPTKRPVWRACAGVQPLGEGLARRHAGARPAPLKPGPPPRPPAGGLCLRVHLSLCACVFVGVCMCVCVCVCVRARVCV